jgi:hypothetical protein
MFRALETSMARPRKPRIRHLTLTPILQSFTQVPDAVRFGRPWAP